jgi:AcrR family transcriptional regulator
MQKRGINILTLPYLVPLEKSTLILLISVSIAIFMTAIFFLSGIKNPSEEDVQFVLDRTEHQISYGFGFSEKDIASINFDELDEIISRSLPAENETNTLLKAVANAIAQAEGNDTSMEMIAKQAGISKSALYSHFKNKEDILRQFFTIEFERIYSDLAAFPKTEKPEEQLYLLGASTIRYLEARPEIMIALDWIRTQRLDWCLALPKTVIERFSDNSFIIKCPKSELQLPLAELPHFILFCIIRLLKNNYFLGKEIQLSTENIRFLYTFLISGIEGFQK